MECEAQLWQPVEGGPQQLTDVNSYAFLQPVLFWGSSLLGTNKQEINIYISFMPLEFWKAIWFQEI
jgi:hypothetical protein